jgi:hypothetical protein
MLNLLVHRVTRRLILPYQHGYVLEICAQNNEKEKALNNSKVTTTEHTAFLFKVSQIQQGFIVCLDKELTVLDL